MLTPLRAEKHGVGMYRNSLYEYRYIEEQQQELIGLKLSLWRGDNQKRELTLLISML